MGETGEVDIFVRGAGFEKLLFAMRLWCSRSVVCQRESLLSTAFVIR